MKFKLILLALFVPLIAIAAPPFALTQINQSDTGRNGNDNTPSFNLNISESLNYTASYVTHYGFILNALQTGGTGDRIGLGVIQTCQATLAGKSCVANAPLVVASGSNLGGYTGSNPRVLAPAGLPNSASNYGGLEIDVETHSASNLRYGLRIVDENMSGGTIVHGAYEDAAIVIVTDTTTGGPGFRVGLQFGENPQGYPQYWPILSGGTLLQASNPSIALNYGIDLSGSTAGFNYQAIALPQNTAGGGIQWGTASGGGTAGSLNSSASTTGNKVVFTDNGILVNNISGGTQLILGKTGNVAMQISPIPIASLPTCNGGLQGAISYVNDSTGNATPTFHGVVAGGGSTSVQSLVSCNGVNWVYN